MLARAGEWELSLEWLRELASGNASNPELEAHGEHWLATLIELLERGGVGRAAARRERARSRRARLTRANV